MPPVVRLASRLVRRFAGVVACRARAAGFRRCHAASAVVDGFVNRAKAIRSATGKPASGSSARRSGVLAAVALMAMVVECGAAASGMPSLAESALQPVAGSGGVKLPTGMDVYATTDAGHGLRCVVGTRTGNAGVGTRPVVYLAKAGGGFAWHVDLRVPGNLYQGRATHCVAAANGLYVLVQMDTDAHVMTDQTLLKVVKLNERTGAVMAAADFVGPDIADAYTAWVEEGAENFRFVDGKLTIRGRYDLMSNWSDPGMHGSQTRSFTLTLPGDLRQ